MQQIWPIEQEDIDRLRKYGKAHIVYSPTKYKWVVSDKFKQQPNQKVLKKTILFKVLSGLLY